MIATMMMNVSHALAAAPDGRWLGFDYGLALLGATFPAWGLVTLVQGWVRGKTAAVVVEAVRRR